MYFHLLQTSFYLPNCLHASIRYDIIEIHCIVFIYFIVYQVQFNSQIAVIMSVSTPYQVGPDIVPYLTAVCIMLNVRDRLGVGVFWVQLHVWKHLKFTIMLGFYLIISGCEQDMLKLNGCSIRYVRCYHIRD